MEFKRPKLGRIDDKQAWICGCGSGMSACHNYKNKLNATHEDKICIWCWKKYYKHCQREGKSK